MKASIQGGGYRKIYEDLTQRLADADIASSAKNLGLILNNSGEAEVPFLARNYLVSEKGVILSGGGSVIDTLGSVIIQYILNASRSETAWRFVTLSQLAGPLFTEGTYTHDALESPLVKRFEGCMSELMKAAQSLGGWSGGEAGLGGVSLIFELLPKIPVQLIFYDRDEEFPARARLLCDLNATDFLEFEFIAVLVTIFVQELKAFHTSQTR
jgi:hypothetical protein